MKFSEIVGHKQLKESLINAIDQARVAHGQLFLGGGSRGSLPLALAYVQYLFCTDRKGGDSCGECSNCYKISHMEHPDLHFIFPTNKSPYVKFYDEDGKIVSDSLIDLFRESVEKSSGYLSPEQWYSDMKLEGKNLQTIIGVSDARSLISKMSMKSYSGGYKCVIIWQAEKMNIQCSNALLKLFEEPAENSLFIFVSYKREEMLPTILSRLQQIDVPPIDSQSMVQYMVKNGVNDPVRQQKLLQVARGDLSLLKRAICSFDGGEASSERFEHFSSLMRICYTQSYVDLIDWGERTSQLGSEDLLDLLSYSTAMCRDSYMKTIGMEPLTLAIGEDDNFLKRFHPYIHHQNIEQLTAEFERASMEISRNGNKRIILVHMALSISKLIRLPR